MGADDRLRWMPLYINDWQTDEFVRQLSPAERGVYIELLMYQWREGSVPDDEELCRRMCGVEHEIWYGDETPGCGQPEIHRPIWRVVKAAFVEIEDPASPRDEGRLVNPKLAALREKALDKSGRLSKIRREAALKSHTNRRKTRSNSITSAKQMQDTCKVDIDLDGEEDHHSNIRSSLDPINRASDGVLPGVQLPSGPTTTGVTGRVRWNEEKQKFDPSVKFKAEFLACWRREFADDDIVEELKKAGRWLVGRPDRRSSRNRLDRFLHNWMARALADRKEQDAGETEAAPPERPEDRWCVKCRELLPEHLRWCPERREPDDVT